MFKDKTIAFIGPGMMAQAMIAGLVRNQVAPAENILASGPRQERVSELQERYHIQPFTNNAEAARQADIVILSVKPQRLDKVLEGIAGAVRPDALVLSILAGVTIGKITSKLQGQSVVRAMPNTPARIGQGITVWTANEQTSAEQRELGRQILTALGKEIFVEEEDYLDKATALSGTGPAYVYLFMEAMVDAGVHLGFSRRIAEQLVVETVRGAVNYYDLHDEHRHLARLRNQVTSPGGTSAEALYYLEKAGFRTAISRAIWAAYERSTALGKED
ncbi:MAG TPA: pyrroline-5-carboxylate reductase [Anaerolineales bacterium]|jgi:pyrroline-5-carboxylate reductase|nr:pyrroline-5-carboxylate reductase [Anaerolineales bacterium]